MNDVAQYCDECQHCDATLLDAGYPCRLEHKPRFREPQTTMQVYRGDWGWHRVCADFKKKEERMSKLREAAHEAVRVYEEGRRHPALATAMYILRTALAKPDEVLAEREACAQACDEIHAKHIAEFGDYLEGSYAKDCADAIRARGKE